MRIHSLPFLFAVAIASIGPLSVAPGLAKPKIVSMGCTAAQLNTPGAVQCIDSNVTEGTGRHVECRGGTISCCNDEPDSHGLPAGFCIDIKKLGHARPPKLMDSPAQTTAQ